MCLLNMNLQKRFSWICLVCWGTHGYKYNYWRLIYRRVEPAFAEISMFSLHCEKPRRWVIDNVLLSWYGVNLLCPLREKMALGSFSSLAESSEILQFPNMFFRLASQCAKLKIYHTWWISKIIGIIFLFLPPTGSSSFPLQIRGLLLPL